eukprot:gene45735-55976_t
MSPPPSPTVPLGDAIQKIVAQIYTDANRTLSNLKAQDPELRTTELRGFLANTKAKLLQLLAVIRWLNKPHVVSLFHSLVQFNSCLGDVDSVMSRSLDEMYFLHGSLFSLRSSRHEVFLAKSILSNAKYPNLPLAVTTAGRKPLPVAMCPKALARKMQIYIQSKLHLTDAIPDEKPYTLSVRDSALYVEKKYVFSVKLTLSCLSVDSGWVILSLQLPSPTYTPPPNHRTTPSNPSSALPLPYSGMDDLQGILG